MLKDTRLSIFFKDQAQIKRLIGKQKEYFIASLTMSHPQMKETYIKLGEYHFDLKIPYIDFFKASEILQEYFILSSNNISDAPNIRHEIFAYFKLMKSFTAKGYLNKMISSDLEDINNFTQTIDSVDQEYLPNKITLNKINWLKGLLNAIHNDLDWSHETQEYFEVWKNELQFIPDEKKQFFEEMEERIRYDAHNLFYFISKNEYSEILPLYTSLLNIYKLSLIMNNALTISHANRVIDNLKLDQLTLLFRKDFFETSIIQEIENVNQQQENSFVVALIDLDKFKPINDTYGHSMGDSVIKKLGKIIRGNTSINDTGFRIGGDEFAIVFKNSSLEEALIVCQTIQNELSQYGFQSDTKEVFHISCCIGVAQYHQNKPKPFAQFFKEVDKNLYQAKKIGKNQIYSTPQ